MSLQPKTPFVPPPGDYLEIAAPILTAAGVPSGRFRVAVRVVDRKREQSRVWLDCTARELQDRRLFERRFLAAIGRLYEGIVDWSAAVRNSLERGREEKNREMVETLRTEVNLRESRTATSEKFLRESSGSLVGNVDRAANVIRGVCLIRLNGSTRWTDAALSQAVRLLERTNVNFNRLEPGEMRSYGDRFGSIRAVRRVDNRVLGDLHYNPKHRLAGQFLHDAEHPTNHVCIELDLRGSSSIKDGREIIEAVRKVECDIVLADDQNTSRNLFESVQTKPTPSPKAKPMTPDQQLQASFGEMLVKHGLDVKLPIAERMAKLKKILEAHEMIVSDTGSTTSPNTSTPNDVPEPGRRQGDSLHPDALDKSTMESMLESWRRDETQLDQHKRLREGKATKAEQDARRQGLAWLRN
jgi:hypothetical protein